MHLGVVSPFPPELTGVGQYGWNVVHGLARNSRVRTVTVLAPRAEGGAVPGPEVTPGLADPDSAVVRTYHVWARDDWLAAARLVRELQSHSPDAVWFNLGFTVFGASRPANFLGLTAPLLARRLGLPVVVTLHQVAEATPPKHIGAQNGRLTALGLRTATHLLLRAGAVCVTLRQYQRVLQAQYGARNVHHIPLGALAPLEDLPRPRRAPAEDILCFGSPAPYKGLPVLLQAFERLQARRPQASLTLAGSDHPRFPGYLAQLEAEVRARNGSGPRNIRWLGAQPEACLRDLFAEARVVVLPYLATTGASSVLHRSVAYGRPVIASDLPDLRATVEEAGLNVDFVPPDDAASLAAALERLLADPARQAQLARHNLDAMRHLTLERTCERYLDLLERPVT